MGVAFVLRLGAGWGRGGGNGELTEGPTAMRRARRNTVNDPVYKRSRKLRQTSNIRFLERVDVP